MMFRFGDTTQQQIEHIQEATGCLSKAEAIRLAISKTARGLRE